MSAVIIYAFIAGIVTATCGGVGMALLAIRATVAGMLLVTLAFVLLYSMVCLVPTL